ncbi:MAG: EscU/YscU/HrcU family type III secretion system export apparatus switch protein [Defluviitaleaceae bacterium]|nr:EscU/YscU/HrcU family type III secretion system export apparatus switch protein [Defluviitaleaceae bacterium]
MKKRAVALQYDAEEIAPKVLAKGVGVIAEKILENAENSEIAIHKDAALVEDLTRLDLGEHIPPDLYEVVAKILVFINNLDKEGEKKWQKESTEIYLPKTAIQTAK